MCFALFAWFARGELLAGIAKTATGKACDECKTLGRLELVCVQDPDKEGWGGGGQCPGAALLVKRRNSKWFFTNEPEVRFRFWS